MTMPRDAEAWARQAAALRGEQQMVESADAIAKARHLAPMDPLIAFLHAQARYEIGYPAAQDFADAQRLWPANPDVIRNHALALASEGAFPHAERLLADTLTANPLWLDGHRVLAGLRWIHGDLDQFDESYSLACSQKPEAASLWLGWFTALAQHRNWSRVAALLDQAEKALGERRALLPAHCFVACETGDMETARILLTQLGDQQDDFLNLCRIRFGIRSGDLVAAEGVALAMVKGPSAGQAWPYLSAIWRKQGDPRAAWLDGDPLFAGQFAVDLSKNELAELAETLRGLHVSARPYAEQSVRGGSQTDRSILLRHEPILRRTRQKLMDAVADFVAELPKPDPDHPFLGVSRAGLQISGSWSVRLRDGGHNVAHTHPMGWISSAFYVALPDENPTNDKAGYLCLGMPPSELGLDLPPYRSIQPKIGQLVLFASTLWHSTIPFASGERLNIAFDVRPSA